jgi:hypothetical protein
MNLKKNNFRLKLCRKTCVDAFYVYNSLVNSILTQERGGRVRRIKFVRAEDI